VSLGDAPFAAARTPWSRRAGQAMAASAPGIVLCAGVAIAAQALGAALHMPALVLALLIGTAVHAFAASARLAPGIAWCSRFLLRAGVALLGLRIGLEQIADLGPETVAIVVVAVVTTVALSLAGARLLGLSRAQGMLTGGASAICGASAALAIAAVLPRSPQNDRYTLLVVLCVSLWSTAAMLLYPLVALALHLPPTATGLFLGGSIQDVAQVVGAASPLGAHSLEAAVLVKLLRVSLLVLVVTVVAWVWRAQACGPSTPPATQAAGGRAALPGFLLVFLGLLLLGNLVTLPVALRDAAGTLSGLCMLLAIAALGLQTELRSLWSLGWRPWTLVAVDALWIAGAVLLGAWALSG
jgi:uncharacterized integral membrane protein (TIGR00698 family)